MHLQVQTCLLHVWELASLTQHISIIVQYMYHGLRLSSTTHTLHANKRWLPLLTKWALINDQPYAIKLHCNYLLKGKEHNSNFKKMLSRKFNEVIVTPSTCASAWAIIEWNMLKAWEFARILATSLNSSLSRPSRFCRVHMCPYAVHNSGQEEEG